MQTHELRLWFQAIIRRLDDIIRILTPRLPEVVLVAPASLTLTGTQTDEVAVAVGDVNEVPIPGVVLDPGATVTVADGTLATAVLSADQASVLVTALNQSGTTTITVNGSVGGVPLAPGIVNLSTSATAPPPVPATIVLTPGVPQGV